MSFPSPLPVLLRRALTGLGVAALASGALAATALGTAVTVHADDQAHQVRVQGDTVAEALAEADVTIWEGDEVVPTPDGPLEPGLEIVVDRAVTVDVQVDGVHAERVRAPVATVGEALTEAGLDDVVDAGASIEPAWGEEVVDGDTVEVLLPVEVLVEADGRELSVSAVEPRVGDALELAGVAVGADDRVEPATWAPLQEADTVTVVRVGQVEVVEEVALDPDEVRRETDELRRGETRVEREGAAGLREDHYLVTLHDGEEVERELVDEAVVEEPVDRLVLVGTRETVPSGGVWDRLAQCEANGNWHANTGNGYYGGLQFLPSTWRSVGGTGLPHEHSREEQIRRGQILQQRSGWGQWPACSRLLGLR